MPMYVLWSPEIGGYSEAVISEAEFAYATSERSPIIHITGFTYGAWEDSGFGYNVSNVTGSTGPIPAPFYGERHAYGYALASLFGHDFPALADAYDNNQYICSELDTDTPYELVSGSDRFTITSGESGMIKLVRESSYDFGLNSLKVFVMDSPSPPEPPPQFWTNILGAREIP